MTPVRSHFYVDILKMINKKLFRNWVNGLKKDKKKKKIGGAITKYKIDEFLT